MGNPDQEGCSSHRFIRSSGRKNGIFYDHKRAYDFVGVVSGSIGFEGAAAVKLAVEASGAITNFYHIRRNGYG